MDKEAIYKIAKKKVKELPCPGSKIRSGGRGRGLGIGGGRGPVGVPVGQISVEQLKAKGYSDAEIKKIKRLKGNLVSN